MSIRRLRTLMIREVRTTLRDPFTLTILITVPVAAMLLFGFVLSTEVHGLRLAVLDGDGTPESRRLVDDVEATGAFIVQYVARRSTLERGLVDGQLGAGLVIPPGFARRLHEGGPPPEVEAIYDAADATLAGNAEAYLRNTIAANGAALVGRPPPWRETGDVGTATAPSRRRAAGDVVAAPAPGVGLVVNVLFNPDLSGVPYMVAGTFGFVLSFLTTLITTVTIVNERMAGTFEQLRVTPATTLEILLGKLLPLGAVFSLDVALMMLLAGLLIGVWPHGSALLFWAVSSFYVVTSLAMGLIFSATSKTAVEAVQKTVLSSIPLVQLSGFAFPIRSMPHALQWVTTLFPATHYIRISRAIYLRGEGFVDVLPEVAILGVFAAIQVVIAIRSLESIE